MPHEKTAAGRCQRDSPRDVNAVNDPTGTPGSGAFHRAHVRTPVTSCRSFSAALVLAGVTASMTVATKPDVPCLGALEAQTEQTARAWPA